MSDSHSSSRPQKIIPYGKQQVTQSDLDAVTDALTSDFLTQGPRIEEFENAFAEYVGAKHAIAVANGTAALHLGALALGVKQGTKVITSPITFAATANSILYCGGEVHFADIDKESWLLDPLAVRKMLEAVPKGTYQGIIPIDFAGLSADMQAFKKLADEYDLWVMEDACHAPGALVNVGMPEASQTGDCRYSDLAIFSFHPVKHIAAGEGGMVTTSNDAIADKIRVLRSHGITKDPKKLSQNPGGWYYEMQALGYNYRLTDIQSALGLSQLKRAEKGLERRREIAGIYKEAFRNLPLEIQKVPEYFSHAYHLFVIRTGQRKALYDYLRGEGIYSQVHYIPLHQLTYYQENSQVIFDLPHSDSYYEECLSLPMYPSLNEEDLNYVIQKVTLFFQ